MADEPIRERILQHCETSLGAIDGTGQYHTALMTIARGRAVADALPNLPAAFLAEGDERIARDHNLLLTRELDITVEIWVRSAAGNLPTLTNRALADLERALTADPRRGGLAVETDPTGSTSVHDEKPGVLASVQAGFTIQYRTVRGNPASIG